MKNTKYTLTTLLCGLLLGLSFSNAQAARKALEGIAAVVDNSLILKSDFNFEYNRIRERLKGQGGTLPPEKILRKQVLEHLILKEVQLQAAARKGIRIDNSMLNDQIANIAAQNKISVAQLKQQVELDGTTYSDYRKFLLEEITPVSYTHLTLPTIYPV